MATKKKKNTPKSEGGKKEVKLDYKKMVKEIDDLVETDFCFDMDCHALHPEQPFTHEEATEMRDILMRVYKIAHCITCTACNHRYSLPIKNLLSNNGMF